MKTLDEHNRAFVAFLFVLGVVALFLNLGLEPLHFEEPRRAIVSLEMELTGNWWVPKINGEYYYNKPPLYNWLLILLFKIFGYEEWVTRMPSVLSLIAIGIVNFYFFRHRIGEKAALFGSVFWITSGDLLFYFSFQGEIDLFYTLIVFLQVLVIFYFTDKDKLWQMFLLSYLLCGIGFLTKGLPSLAFQALTILGLMAYRRRFSALFHPAHFAGISLLALTIGGFFLKYSQYNDPLPYIVRLISESTSRTAVGDQSFWSSIQHLFEFPLMLLTISSPWIILVIWCRKQLKPDRLKMNRWVAYCLIFLVVNLPVYWLSAGTRERYLYMFLPFLFNILAFTLPEKAIQTKTLHYTLASITSLLALIALSIPFIERLGSIESRYLIMIGLLLSFGGLSYLLFSAKNQPILVFVAVLLILRIGFDLLVLPPRSEKRRQENYEAYAEQINQTTNGAPVALTIPIDTVYYSIPFTKDSLAYRDAKWPPYQLSYYLSRLNRAILDNQASNHEWVLRDVEVEANEDLTQILKVDIPSKGKYFILEQR